MIQKRFLWLTFLACGVMMCSSAVDVLAQEAETIAQLKEQIVQLQRRVDQLEAEKQETSSRAQSLDPWGVPQSGRSWDPWYEIQRMQDEMNNLFQDSMGRSGRPGAGFSSTMSFEQNFDMTETDKGYEIRFDMKGLDKNKVDVKINPNSITVQGEYSQQNEQKDPGRYLQAQSFGSFMKTIPLPTDADTTKVKTEKEGDTLVIRLPKKI